MTDQPTAAAASANLTDQPAAGRGAIARAADAWEELFRAQVAIMRRLAADDVWGEISMREYDVLYTLTRAGRPLRLAELNEHILLTQPSLSRMVERLGGRGLVRRTEDPRDGRCTLIELTERGGSIQRRIGARHAAAIAHYLGHALSPAQIEELTEVCRRLRAAQVDIPDFLTPGRRPAGRTATGDAWPSASADQTVTAGKEPS